jgi:eukaryotic-like serine/threonine-protein kinase
VRRQGALDPIKVAEYGAQACAALTVAHGYGIIHRDVKPQNIVLTPDGTIKNMDFGIARAVDSDATQTGSVLGTAQYVSPEQAQGQKLGPESDLYSLGVVLYELATGRLPFEGETPVSVALRHVNDIAPAPRSINPDIPPALEAVIIKAMQKDPTKRYRSAEDMREDLLRVVAGRAVAATPRVDDTSVMPAVGRTSGPASVERVATSRRGANPWIWAAVVILAIMLGLGGAWALGAFNGGPKVPVTAGLTIDAAKQAITDAGLAFGTETKAADPNVPSGQVISSDPAAGTQVDRGSPVNLTVSSGPEMVDVPSVIGSGETSAVAELQNAGFAVDPFINREFNAKYPNGVVFKSVPAEGTSAPKGSKVSIWVSQGAEMVQVPTVVGKTQTDATTALNDAGFDVKVKKQPDPTVAKGAVISQTPAGATQAPKASAVTIVVSTGPEQVTVPNLLSPVLTQAEAVAKIQALGLVESVQTLTGSAPADIGMVKDQDPPAGTKVNKGSTVTIWVGGP